MITTSDQCFLIYIKYIRETASQNMEKVSFERNKLGQNVWLRFQVCTKSSSFKLQCITDFGRECRRSDIEANKSNIKVSLGVPSNFGRQIEPATWRFSRLYCDLMATRFVSKYIFVFRSARVRFNCSDGVNLVMAWL